MLLLGHNFDGRMTEMPKGISDKTITAWFEKLDYDAQAAVLASLTDAHTSVRQMRISALKQQIEALGGDFGGNGRKKAAGKVNGNGGAHKARVAAKYRDPKTGDTWSGRGRMAGWLAAKVKAGQKAEKFLIG